MFLSVKNQITIHSVKKSNNVSLCFLSENDRLNELLWNVLKGSNVSFYEVKKN